MNEIVTYLTWDSDHWGITIGKVNCFRLNTDNANLIKESLSQEQWRCLYFLADATCPLTINLAHSLGFRFIDTRITLELELGKYNRQKIPFFTKKIERATEAKMHPLQSMAASSHNNTRFFKDQNFDQSRAEQLYSRWIERDLERGIIFVTKSDTESANAIDGYISCYISEGYIGHISLIAVNSSVRGQGVGNVLLQKALDYFWDNQCKRVVVPTQADNIAALRLYEKAGFCVTDSKVWFHHWSPTGT